MPRPKKLWPNTVPGLGVTPGDRGLATTGYSRLTGPEVCTCVRIHATTLNCAAAEARLTAGSNASLHLEEGLRHDDHAVRVHVRVLPAVIAAPPTVSQRRFELGRQAPVRVGDALLVLPAVLLRTLGRLLPQRIHACRGPTLQRAPFRATTAAAARAPRTDEGPVRHASSVDCLPMCSETTLSSAGAGRFLPSLPGTVAL